MTIALGILDLPEVLPAAATQLRTADTPQSTAPLGPEGASASPKRPSWFRPAAWTGFGRAFFGGYAEIFFLQGGMVGAALCAVMLLEPQVGLAGLLAALAAYGFARLIRMDQAFRDSGYYIYNPLLVGLSLGHLFALAPLSVLLVAVAGILTLLVTVALAQLFTTYLRLPVLSLPFVIVSTMAYLASQHYPNLPHHGSALPGLLAQDFGLPAWAAGYLRCWGALLFMPSVMVGFLFSLLVLGRSRILFLLSILGYALGTSLRRCLLGSPRQAYEDLLNFNFILIAMAVGGVFLVPSARSYLIAAISVAVSALVMDAITGFWSKSDVPAFTLPFNLVCLGVLYVLGFLADPQLARRIGRTPEETLDEWLASRLRFCGSERTLLPPFAGKWTVWQGFDGQWTHKGPWRFAYDFVIADDEGHTCACPGEKVQDYFCFNKPVLAPVRGRVARVVNHLPDNPIGEPGTADNWGNLVVIQDPRGFHVALSHFAQHSIRVSSGDWVERGAVLGRCGNSGYSPQPHLHVQAQMPDTAGAASVPFSFISYVQNGVYHANDLPPEGAPIEPLYAHKDLDCATNFALEEEYLYSVQRGGRSCGELRLRVKMALDGMFYFDSGRGMLFFGKHEGTFYFYRCAGKDPRLRLLLLALPRLPLAHRQQLVWHDTLPAGLVLSGWRAVLVGVVTSFWPKLGVARVTQRFASQTEIHTQIEVPRFFVRQQGTVTFNHQKGFLSLSFGDWQLNRKNHAT